MSISNIAKIFKEWKKNEADKIEMLPVSGSNRRYYRIFYENTSILAAFNVNVDENEAYFSITTSFLKHNIPVPKIEYIAANKQCYFVEDIGNESLYNLISNSNGQLSEITLDCYKKALKYLVQMQVVAGQTVNYEQCYPVPEFNDDAIQWDLNYFKYSFLKLANASFNEYDLENDFKKLKTYLLDFPRDYFMFRDFQSRNILLKNNEPYFIDFQGGRKGPLTYDVASLLYQAKAQIPEIQRNLLFDYYYNELSTELEIDYKDLKSSFKAFALLRTLQVLGAYGFRGFFEKKPHFIESIPFAINNFKELISNSEFPLALPHLKQIAESLLYPTKGKFQVKDKLTVSITSFSYRKGIPSDPSENGGGFVFDCRSIHNPGRYDEYKTLTGKDQPVIDFFENEDEMDNFLESVFKLVDRSIEVYQQRNFKHLMVNFGCTGGQHRSVYSAERLSKHLTNKYDMYVSLWHREQD